MPSDLGALGGTRTPNLLIRRSGQVVQDRPPPVVGWADIPGLSTCVGRRPMAWLQSWLQSPQNGANGTTITGVRVPRAGAGKILPRAAQAAGW